MGLRYGVVQVWINEGERPDNSLPVPPVYPGNVLPGAPVYPGQGLPGGGGGYPSQPIYLPPYPSQGLPPYPDQGLPQPPVGIWPTPPGGPRPDQGLPGGPPVYPSQGLPGSGGYPDQGLPPTASPKAYDVPPEPTSAPTSGTWVVAVYAGVATWVFLPDQEHMPPPEGGAPPVVDNTLPETGEPKPA